MDIYNPTGVYRKVAIKDGEIVMGYADLIITYGREEISVIEAKVIRTLSNNKKVARITNEIRKKLERNYEVIKSNFDILPDMIGVYRIPGKPRFQHFRVPKPIDDLIGSVPI